MQRPPLPPDRRPQQQQPPNPNKRPRPLPSPSPSPALHLNELERKLYDAIRSKQDTGIWIADLRRDTGTSPAAATKIIRSLLSKRLIKEVKDMKNPSRKTYMASDFHPSKEMSGGSWYVDGALDTDLVTTLRQVCLHCIRQSTVATVDMIVNFISRTNAFKMDVSVENVSEILGTMVLDREVDEIVSTGVGDSASVPKGRTCYRAAKGKPGEVAVGGLAGVPCGVCPRIHECSPDGVISPATCVYFDQWMGF